MVYVGYRSRWTLGALGATLFGVITFACSTFGDEKEDGGGGPDAASSEVVADAPGGDGSSADASPDGEPPSFVAPACPRAKPPACVTSGSGCNAEELYRPQGAPTYPFAIATDSKSIFWIEQDHRDGAGLARVLRVRKGGGVADVLAKDQASTIAIGVLGDHVYWGAANELRRTPRECVAPCTVDVVADVPNARHIAPAGPGALLVLAGNGTLYRYRADAPGIALVTSPSVGTNNFIATGAAENVAVGFTVDTIVVVPFDGAPTSRTIQPPRDAGDKGFPLVASDCNTYAGIGGTDPVLRAIGLDGTTTALQAMTGANDSPFGIAADEGVFYVGFANNGGLHMVDGNAKTGRKIAEGDVWRVTTDADGIYWGEHENGPKAGRLYRIRRK